MNWRDHVRRRLPKLKVPAERALEIVDELALQLEAAYDSAIARGASHAEAYAHALSEVPDWTALGATLTRSSGSPCRRRHLDHHSPQGSLLDWSRRFAMPREG